MPAHKPTLEPWPTDELLLAAIARAERHQQRSAVALSILKGHLGIAHNGATTRRLRPQLETLIAAEQIQRSRRHSVIVWSLTSQGRKRLEAAQGAGQVGELPESPQHQNWSKAQTIAGERIEQYHDELHRVLADTAILLGTEPPAPSEDWIARGDQLERACRRYGSALYCRREWAEPDDAQADLDQSQHLSRRTFWL